MKKILIGILLFVLVCCMGSCRVQRPMTTEREGVHDTLYMSKLYRDTVYHQDSVFMVMELRNDTVFRERVQYKYIYKEHTRTDTMYVSHRDTTIVTKTMETNRLNKWQSLQIAFGRIMLLMTIALAIVTFLYFRQHTDRL